MNTTTISAQDLIAKAGANVPQERVKFDGDIFDGTLAFADNPMEAGNALHEAVMGTLDHVERTMDFPGVPRDELAVALNSVLHMLDAGVPEITSWMGMDTPSTRRVCTGYNWSTGEMGYSNIPGGFMTLPGFRNLVTVSSKQKACICVKGSSNSNSSSLQANVIRQDQGKLEGIFAFVREMCDSNSIYCGQVIDPFGNFIDMTRFKPENVALTAEAASAVDLLVRQQFKNPGPLSELRQSPKTSILFEGPPGGGKTMTVSLAEYLVANSGGVVIHVDPDQGLSGFSAADDMAERLLNAGHVVLIAMEDVEKLAQQSRARALEILDGASSKTKRRIVIGTTNFLESIDRAMLRAGRFDAIIHCGLPDLGAFTHLLKVLMDEHIMGEINYEKVFPHFEGYSYATIAQAVSFVIRSAVAASNSAEIKIEEDDLIRGASMVRRHHEILGETPIKEEDKIGELFREMHMEVRDEVVDQIQEEAYDRTDYDHIQAIVNEEVDNRLRSRLDGATILDHNDNESTIHL